MKTTYLSRIFIVITFFLSNNLGAQGWTQITDFPSSARDDGTSFTIGATSYCGTGLEVGWNPTSDFFAFDMLSDSWSPISSLPASEARQYASGFASSNYGYVFGGLSSSGYLNDLWRYDPALDSWTEMTSIPSEGRSGSACFVIGDTVYILGGKTENTQAISEVWAYSFTSDNWTLKNPLPDSLWRSSAISFQGKGYTVFGINNSGAYNNEVFEYSPISDSWTSISTFPGVGRAYAGISLLNNEIVLIAGRDSLGNSYNDMWSYDPQFNSWDLNVNLPSDQRRGGLCFSSNTAVYCSTGINLNDVRLTETWKYDLFLDVHEINSESIILSPNPAESFIKLSGNTNGIIQYQIMTANGHVLQSGKVNNEEPISIEYLSKGYYLVTIQYESISEIKKLIVL